VPIQKIAGHFEVSTLIEDPLFGNDPSYPLLMGLRPT
jgi:hypothetical protein